MELEETMWWWGVNGDQLGPLNTVGLVMQLVSGTIPEDTLVWCADMENWTRASEVAELMDLVTLLRNRKVKQPWTAPPGEHEVPPECAEWIDNISSDARNSLFHTAINKYMPAIMRGHPEARDALLKAFASRHPAMEGEDDCELSDDFLLDVLEQCEDMRMREFYEIFLAGNEQHIKPLLLAAAQLDASFMDRLRNASRLSVAAKFVEQGDSKGLLESIGDKPQLIHSRNIDGACLLHKIAQLERLDMLKDIVAWQKASDTLVNWDCRDAAHNTPLHLAVTNGNVEMAKVLLEAGADVNVQNRNQSEYASGQWGAKGSGGEFVVPINPENATPLHLAAEQCDLEMVAELLKHQPELETPDSSGMTALHAALEGADDDCVIELLKAGANPMSTNPVFGEGVTCLHKAASRGLHGIVAAILQHCQGVDVNAADAEGWRPLHLAARKGSVKAVELLLAKGADKDAVNKQGQTAAYLAEVNKKAAVVALLSSPGS